MSSRARLKTVIGILIKHGAVGGIPAGIFFALLQMVILSALGRNIFFPWRLFASVVLGSTALDPAIISLGVALVMGLLTHFFIAMLYGAIYGGLVLGAISISGRKSYLQESLMGIIYGLVVYVINYQIIARLFFPWFLTLNQTAQILIHGLGYGFILAFYCAWSESQESSIKRVFENP